MKRVLIVGSAEQSGGGVATVIKLIKQMPVWEKYHCYWLGTQIQAGKWTKLRYALTAYLKALFIIWQYDIVHFHTVPDRICLFIQMPIFILALLSRKRIIMHIHMGNQLRNHANNRLFKWHLKRADLVILLAKKWEGLFHSLFSDIKTPTTVIYNACETVPEVPFEEKEKMIIMVAFFNDNKAPDLLLKAWQRIKGQFPDWRIYMLGNGEVERFQKMADDMGLLDTVTFTGYITGEEKDNFFRKASILTLCSYEEGFPMVVLEAWVHHICVISTPVGGLPDVIDEGRNVMTFRFGDWEGLAEKLVNLMSSEYKRQEMADFSRKFVYQVFSEAKINDSIEMIYKRLQT